MNESLIYVKDLLLALGFDCIRENQSYSILNGEITITLTEKLNGILILTSYSRGVMLYKTPLLTNLGDTNKLILLETIRATIIEVFPNTYHLPNLCLFAPKDGQFGFIQTFINGLKVLSSQYV